MAGKGTGMKVWAVLGIAGRLWAAEPCLQGIPTCSEKLSGLPVYRTHALTETDDKIESLVLVIHGVLRNANEYFEAVTKAATVEKATEHTAILAPHFKNQNDNPAPDELRWRDDDWKRGELSTAPEPRLSSFAVLDRLLTQAIRNFPKLRRVVVTGHSAGGQVLSRYTVSTELPKEFPALRWRFIVANPSSYFYLSEDRPRPTEGCPEYDDYPYGIKKPNEYLAKVSADTLLENARDREQIIFLGGLDTETELLDQSCEANAQGANRLERGLLYYQYLKNLLHPALLRQVTVPKLGHFGDLMYQSDEGREILFH